MSLEIKKIQLSELESFLKSKIFKKFAIVPITQERAISYIHNPNSKPDDVVLYLGFIDNQLIAFRTLFAGQIISNKQPTRFAWCSGNWVHPNFRRLGYSEELLKLAYIDWNKKLMFTNYAPNSEKLYIKTRWFQTLHQFKGVRAYLFPKTRKLISKSNKNAFTKFIFSLVDYITSVVSHLRIFFYKKHTDSNITFEIKDIPDEQCYSFIRDNSIKSVFEREEELRWIFKYPWISREKQSDLGEYPFSNYLPCFQYKTVKVFRQNKFIGFFVFSVNNQHLKTLFFNLSVSVEKQIGHFFKQYCIKNKIEVLTIYNSLLAKQISTQNFPFLYTKKYGQKIYSSFEINNREKFQFQDGDGDVIFT